MRRRVRGSRGVKRRWGPHISSPWPKGRENKGDEVTVLTACGIETLQCRECNSAYLHTPVATVLTACGMRRRGPHISSPWPTGGENKGNEVTVFTACGIETLTLSYNQDWNSWVATVLTACGMRRRVRGSRGAKRRWGPHISSPWPKGRENKGEEVTVLTACGMRRRVRGRRGTKWRWGPHISSPWLKGRENKGDEVTALTAYDIETAQFWIH